MYCIYSNCNCTIPDQIEDGCSDCTLRRGSSNSVYPLDELLEEAQDRIEERRAIYGSEIL